VNHNRHVPPVCFTEDLPQPLHVLGMIEVDI